MTNTAGCENRVDVRSQHHSDCDPTHTYKVIACYQQGGSWTISQPTFNAASKLQLHWIERALYAQITRIEIFFYYRGKWNNEAVTWHAQHPVTFGKRSIPQ